MTSSVQEEGAGQGLRPRSIMTYGITEIARRIRADQLAEARAIIASRTPAEHRARMRELDRASDEAAERREQLRVWGLSTWELDEC